MRDKKLTISGQCHIYIYSRPLGIKAALKIYKTRIVLSRETSKANVAKPSVIE
jgi:hypothetical protein